MNWTPSGFHQLHSTSHIALVQLHVGNAVGQQTTDTVGSLKHGDPVPGLVQLGGTGQPGGTRADHGHALARALFRRLGDHPALCKALVDDGALDILDGHGRIVDAEHAGTLARGRADATGELRKIVGLVQTLEGFLPQTAVDEVVPLRYEVVDRTP